jgi:hypothetical protein
LAQIRLSVETFIEGIFRQGAFQWARTKNAYIVKGGRGTTTADQAPRIIHIMMGFASLKPAEFVILNIQQKARPIPFGKRP